MGESMSTEPKIEAGWLAIYQELCSEIPPRVVLVVSVARDDHPNILDKAWIGGCGQMAMYSGPQLVNLRDLTPICPLSEVPEKLARLAELEAATPCCERDHNKDGYCDGYEEGYEDCLTEIEGASE